MRFVIVSLTCLPLFIMGCAFFSPSSESGPNPQQNHAHKSHTHDSTDDDNRLEADLQTVELGGNPRQMSRRIGDRDTKAAEDHGWNDEVLQHLVMFQSLLSTDIEAAHTKIAEIAKIRFGSHPLTDEWSELFFRLYRDRKGHVLDVKRYWELEIQLLSDIDSETYAKGIQEYQLGMKQIDLLIKMIESQGGDPEATEADFNFNFSSYLKGE